VLPGDDPGELWYAEPETSKRIQRAAPAASRRDLATEFFLADGRPSAHDLASAREAGCAAADLWVPVAGIAGKDGRPALDSASGCLGLLRAAGFEQIRLFLPIPAGTGEKPLREVVDLLLRDRGPMEVWTLALRGNPRPAAGADPKASKRLRFYAALYVLTRCAKMSDNSIWVILTDPFLRERPEMLAELALNSLMPGERVMRLRRKVEDLAAHLPAAEPSAASPEGGGTPSLSRKLKDRAKENLPAPVWQALRRVRHAVTPPKES